MSVSSFNVFSVTQQENAVEADTVGLTLILSWYISILKNRQSIHTLDLICMRDLCIWWEVQRLLPAGKWECKQITWFDGPRRANLLTN